MTLHVITDYKVAANPVAKAIARAKVTKALLHAKLQVYSLEHGAECRGLLTEIGMVLAVIGMAGELDPKVGPHDSGVRIIRGGLSAINQMNVRAKWDSAQAVALEVAMNAAEDLNRVIKARYVLDAWEKLTEVPRAA